MKHEFVLGPFTEGEKLSLLQSLVATQEFVDLECDTIHDDSARTGLIGWYRIHEAIVSWYEGYTASKYNDAKDGVPQDVLIAARIFCLSSDELYFLDSPDELRRALNHRNEAAALSLMHQKLAEDNFFAIKDTPFLDGLERYCSSLWNQFHDISSFPLETGKIEEGEDTMEFLTWSKEQGIKSRLVLGNFGPHGIRGCMAEEDIHVGADLLSIPQETLIYDETVLKTDVGQMLSAIPGLSMDNLLILFTMIDRWDDDSAWRPFWKELPVAFKTGISFHPSLVELLRGSAAFDEIKQAQCHIQSQYEACTGLFDILVSAYPKYLSKEMFSYEKYVWAVELWYSYAFEIEFPPSTKSKTVMVPFACLVNHSPWPHVVRYGRMDMSSKSLRYPLFRPCRKGEQAFISYGPVPNMKLLAYYGFAIEGNPHDIVPLTLDISKQSKKVQQALDSISVSLDHNLRNGTIPKKLKACMRVIVANSDELEDVIRGREDPLQGEINPSNEEQAKQTMYNALKGVHDSLKHALQQYNDQAVPGSWELSASFCKIYLANQFSIMEKCLDACL